MSIVDWVRIQDVLYVVGSQRTIKTSAGEDIEMLDKITVVGVSEAKILLKFHWITKSGLSYSEFVVACTNWALGYEAAYD